MPHTRSAKNNLRKTQKRRMHNRAALRDIKDQIKKVLEVDETGTLDQLKKEYNLAAKKLDKAASRKVVHPNLASRKKSQLARLVNKKAGAGKAPAAAAAKK